MPKVGKRHRKRKSHYHTGMYVSTKTGKSCKYRSGWELLYMQWLDVNVDVRAWSYEGVIIPYVSNVRSKKMRRYFPDFLVEYKDAHVELVEIKPAKRVHQANVHKKLMAAGDHCRAHGWSMVILTEIELKGLGLL